MKHLLGNAVFLKHVDNAHKLAVIIFDDYSKSTSISNAQTLISEYATSLGARWGSPYSANTTADPVMTYTHADLPVILRDFDVFVIYSQPNATDDQLIDLADEWSQAMIDFLDRGKVVVVLEGNTIANTLGTPRLVSGTGFINFDFNNPPTSYAANNLTSVVVSPGDAVARNVLSMYRAEPQSIVFRSLTPTIVFNSSVLVNGVTQTLPMVIHVSRVRP